MKKTKIEWCDYAVNPVKGYCPMACPYCYARRMYDRFGWDKTIRFDYKCILDTATVYEPSRFFVGSTMELFGEWVPDERMEKILHWASRSKNHTYIFLTKLPENLAKWNPWPPNAWVGVTATNNYEFQKAMFWLWRVRAKVRFVSFEPLLGEVDDNHILADRLWIDWMIIGAQTGPGSVLPDRKWVDALIGIADKQSMPVFLKDNLHWPEQRREWPKVLGLVEP